MPYYSKLDYADLVHQSSAEEAVGGGDRRKAGSSVESSVEQTNDSGGSFDLTEHDVIFFNHVLPPIEWTARIMSWINLITCGLRFFAFIYRYLLLLLHCD